MGLYASAIVLAGVVLNIYLWIAYAGIFWMWWNLFGLLAAVTATWVVSRFTRPRPEVEIAPYTLTGSGIYSEIPLWSRGETYYGDLFCGDPEHRRRLGPLYRNRNPSAPMNQTIVPAPQILVERVFGGSPVTV